MYVYIFKIYRKLLKFPDRAVITMSDDAEQQAEEIEVLKSIYEGDEDFKQLDDKTYQYKVCTQV